MLQIKHYLPLIPVFGSILRVREGSKFSRIFSHIFSHRSIKQLFGANIALAIVMAGFLPVKSSFADKIDLNVITAKTLVTTTKQGIEFPTAGKIKINQGYWALHPGLDIDGEIGDPVHAVMSGKVEATESSRYNYGNAIIVDHGSGLTSLYAHLSKIEVKIGEEVTNSKEIGKIGTTGHSTGPHLHLEIRQDGRPINPLSVLPKIK